MAGRKFQKKKKRENKMKLSLFVFLLFVLYLLLGSVIFSAIEKDNEEDVTNDLSEKLDSFLEQNECVSPLELQSVFFIVRTSIRNGAYAINVNSTIEPDLMWDTISGVFFCFTIVTTIGFGHITPKTVGGQAFCIVYATIGIPITGYLLSLLGDNFEQFWTWYQRLCNRKFRFIRSARLRKITIIAFGIAVVLVLTLFIPSYYWKAEEDWSYWTGLYYTFITMTTIGFGDYVASIDDSNVGLVNRIFDLIVTIFTILLTLGIVTGTLKVARRIDNKSFGASRLSTMMKKLIGNEATDSNYDTNSRNIKTVSKEVANSKTNGNINHLQAYAEGPSRLRAGDHSVLQSTQIDDENERRVSETSEATDLSCQDVSLELINSLELYVNSQLIISKDGLSDDMISDIRDVIKNHILDATRSNHKNRFTSIENEKTTMNGQVNGGFLNDSRHSVNIVNTSQETFVCVDMHHSGLRSNSIHTV